MVHELPARARAVPVPDTPLLQGALPRVDFADAYALPCGPSAPRDPETWADALRHSPPAWVAVLLAARERLVGLVGIERAGPSAFALQARRDDELLVGADQRHLSFRASLLREPERVVVSTVVQVHNRRGRLYWALVRHLHPAVVRASLSRAARSLPLG